MIVFLLQMRLLTLRSGHRNPGLLHISTLTLLLYDGWFPRYGQMPEFQKTETLTAVSHIFMTSQ